MLTGVLAEVDNTAGVVAWRSSSLRGWARVLALSMLSRKMEVEVEKRILVLNRMDLFQFVFAGKMSSANVV